MLRVAVCVGTMQPMHHLTQLRSRYRIGIVVTGLAIAITVVVSGCSTLGYFGQAAAGHLSLLSAAQPVEVLLDDPQTPAPLKRKLEQAQQMRAFASSELGLPQNRSYTAYADLGRPAVVWNVFATPELSLQLKTWCYPLFGCAGYRGYFDKARAEAFAAELRAQGDDVYVAPVTAYSTLGWMNWAGGDPLLNTFIHWPEPELARLIFHELAHQVVYVKDDTAFNESFATAVERAGVQHWLARHGDEALRGQWLAYEQRHADFLHLLQQYRQQLQAVYDADLPDAVKRERKRAVFDALKAASASLIQKHGPRMAGYFSAPLGGAHLAAVAAYNDWVSAFEVLRVREQGDWPRFYAQVQRLAQRAPDERTAALRALQAQAAMAPAAPAAAEGPAPL